MRLQMLLLVCVFAFALNNCERIPKDPQQQYKKAMESASKKDWDKTAQLLELALQGELPPEEQEIARITLANAYYYSGNYENAILNYEEFLQLYPASRYAKEALFRLGLSYMELIKGPEWEQTFTKKALKTFQEFVKRYPQAQETKKAKEYIKILKKILAEHELYIAGTYDMTHKFTASAKRYEEIKKKYKGLVAEDRLLYLLGRAYYFTDVQSEEEIGRIKRELKKVKKKLKSKDPSEVASAKNRLAMYEEEIKKWKEIAKKNRLKGKKILEEVIRKFPNSQYSVKARRILSGEKILDVEPVKSPLKRSLWWKIRKTL